MTNVSLATSTLLIAYHPLTERRILFPLAMPIIHKVAITLNHDC